MLQREELLDERKDIAFLSFSICLCVVLFICKLISLTVDLLFVLCMQRTASGDLPTSTSARMLRRFRLLRQLFPKAENEINRVLMFFFFTFMVQNPRQTNIRITNIPTEILTTPKKPYKMWMCNPRHV